MQLPADRYWEVFLGIQVVSKVYERLFSSLLIGSRGRFSDSEPIRLFRKVFAFILGGCVSTAKLNGEKKISADLRCLHAM